VALGLSNVTLHAWRHTHASQLIASGMDVLTISRRLGQGSASITLNVYGHLFHASDDRAASVFENAFSRVLGEQPSENKPEAIGWQFLNLGIRR
jgi:integrase